MSLLDPIKALLPFETRRNLKKALGIPLRIDPDWDLLQPLGPREDEHVVLDVGAFKGYFIKCWKKFCPKARFHCFEPTPHTFQKLQELYGDQPDIRLNQAGLAEEAGELEIQMSSNIHSCNSFLAPKQSTWQENRYEVGELTTTQVPVWTLDNYLAEQKIDRVYLMKIDVQGYELKVLQGGEKRALGRIDHILVESGIRPFYEGAPRFSDVFNYLTSQGFHLMGMRAYHLGKNTLMEADMLFRRDDLMPEISPNPSGEKIYQSVN